MTAQKNSAKEAPRFAPTEPSPELLETILWEIELEKRRIARRRFAFSSAILIASAVGFIQAYQFLRAEFYASGFSQFLSLIFSDPEIAFTYWQDFGLALLEFLPSAGVVVFLSATFVLLWSLKHLITTTQNTNITMQKVT